MEKEKSFLRDGTKICETIFKFAILAFSFFETRERIEEEGGEKDRSIRVFVPVNFRVESSRNERDAAKLARLLFVVRSLNAPMLK